MNAQRRKEIDNIISKLEDLKQDIVSMQDEEQGYFDNMPEGLQSSEKGEKAESAVDALDNSVSLINDAIDSLMESMG